MADLEIKIIGDGKSAQDTFKKLSQNVQEATGYIGKMEAEMKLLKAQMRHASESDIPAMRTQFLGLKNAIREAQYGSESFTKKIGGEFDQALQKANKNLFSLTNLAKGLTAGFGIGAIAHQFLEATGAADALNSAIKKVVQGIKDIGMSKIEIDLRDTTIPLYERVQKYLDSQLPADFVLINELQERADKLSAQLLTSTEQSKLGKVTKTFKSKEGDIEVSVDREGVLSSKDRARVESSLAALNERIVVLKNLQEQTEKTKSATSDLYEEITPKDFAEDSPLSLSSSIFMREVEMETDAENRATEKREQDKFDAWLKRHQDMTSQDAKQTDERLQAEKKIADARIQYMDRAGARLANVFEDAVAAGMRGGFNDFLRNYMQQIGLKTFSGLLRLAFSSATGGSFGAGGLLGHIFGFAGGGEFYTNGAMPIIVGDNPGGVEKVTVEPISGRGTTGLKNGHLALAGGGSVMSAPSFHNQGAGGNIELTLEVDKVNLGKVLYMPNGVVDTINRMRANPV